jgi:hypothetical protein
MIKELYKYIFRKSATLLNRHQLGSINLSDIPAKSESEIKDYNAKVSIYYPLIKLKVDELVKAQTEFMAKECVNEDQFLFSRGTINGLVLVLDEMNRCKGMHDEEVAIEKFNKFSTL